MSALEGGTSGPLVVEIDSELRPLVGGFLEKRRAEILMLRQAVEGSDLEALRAAGHNLKGLGGGYGFDALTDLGRSLEERARAGDLSGCREMVEAIADFLARVQVVFREG